MIVKYSVCKRERSKLSQHVIGGSTSPDIYALVIVKSDLLSPLEAQSYINDLFTSTENNNHVYVILESYHNY